MHQKYDGKKHDYEQYYYLLKNPDSEQEQKKAECIISNMKTNNKLYSQQIMNSEIIEKQLKGQRPQILWIGCADSRVCPNMITGLGVGEIFVHRNVANLVRQNDNNINAVINYAVVFLKVKHIIVCGHQKCGGIGAAFDEVQLPHLKEWVEKIKQIKDNNWEKLEKIENLEDRINKLIEMNVMKQCHNLMKNPVIRESIKKNNYPKIHGWIYQFDSGLIQDLEISPLLKNYPEEVPIIIINKNEDYQLKEIYYQTPSNFDIKKFVEILKKNELQNDFYLTTTKGRKLGKNEILNNIYEDEKEEDLYLKLVIHFQNKNINNDLMITGGIGLGLAVLGTALFLGLKKK